MDDKDKDKPMFVLPPGWEGIRLVKADWIAEHANESVHWLEFDKQTKRLSRRTIQVIFDIMGPALKGMVDVLGKNFDVVGELLEQHKTRLLAAEAKSAALEAAQHKTLADSFRGAWMPGTVFVRGSLVVHDGSTWLALVDSDGRPGACADWKVLARAGRPGKDATP